MPARSNQRRQHFFLFTFVLLLLLAVLPALTVLPTAQATSDIIYVKPSASGTGDGSSWANATTLQDALTSHVQAGDGDQIWLAAGVHYPVTPADPNNVTSTERAATFQLVAGVTIYGGFPATGAPTMAERDWQTHVTVLSGDIDANDTTDASGIVTATTGITGTNVYRVVTGADNTTLDGVTITAGLANGSAYDEVQGGGMYNSKSSPALINVTFSGNRAGKYGGAMYNSESSPTLTNVTFSGNRAGEDGGAMYNSYNSSPTLTNVTFSGNQAHFKGGGMYGNYHCNPTLTNVIFSGNSTNIISGGGMYNYMSNPVLTNVIFSGNDAGHDGGGMYNSYNSSPTLTNVTFSGNRAGDDGHGIYNTSGSNPTIQNSIIWGNAPTNEAEVYNDGTSGTPSNPTYTHTLVQGMDAATLNSTGGTNNLDGTSTANAPQFVRDPDPGADTTWGTADDDYGDLRLQAGSPVIDAGDNDADLDGSGSNTARISGMASDLSGSLRISNCTIDLGAYEYQGGLNSYGNLAFQPATRSGNEGDSGTADTVIATIERSGGSDCPVSVEVALTGSSTATGDDYTGNLDLTLSFAAGQTSQDITLPIVGDTSYEPDETIHLELRNAALATLGTQQTTTYTITNDDAPSVSIDSKPGFRTSSTGASFSFSGPANAGGVSGFQCQINFGGWEACNSPQTYSGLSEDDHTFEVRAVASSGDTGPAARYQWFVDSSAPPAPEITSFTPTRSTTPIWRWSSGGTGNGTFRYKLNDSDLSSGATETTATSFTPAIPLPGGTHTLYVQERNDTGTWSETGSFAITIEVDVAAPTVNGTTPTSDTTPTWSWVSGGGGNGIFRYKLHDTDLRSGATETTATSFTPDSPMAAGTHTLYVQERDASGSWSVSGSFAITIETPTPDITPNFTTGAPGSVFILTVPDLPANASAAISVRAPGEGSYTPLGTLTVPGDGTLVLLLETAADAPVGTYTIRIVVQTSATSLAETITRELALELDSAAPLRTERPDGDVPTIDTSAGDEPTGDEPTGDEPTGDTFVYLPLVQG